MKRFILIPALLVSVAASAASADVIVGSSGAAWQAFPTTLNSSSPNRPYWDNGSMDGTNLNIGDYLKGPFPGNVSPAITPNWWGKTGAATSNYDNSFTFASTGGAGIGALQLEVAGNASVNIVGWYDVSNPSVKHVIWNGTDSSTTNASAVFTPSANYGYYLSGPGGTFYTDSSLNTTDKASQHFAVFANSLVAGNEKYTIGIEDLPANTFANEKIGDFNDFIFTVQTVSTGTPNTPEPASLGILTIGAAGLLLRRRKNAAK